MKITLNATLAVSQPGERKYDTWSAGEVEVREVFFNGERWLINEDGFGIPRTKLKDLPFGHLTP